LAHPVLISDEWRRKRASGRDGALAVEESSAEPTRGCASTRSGVSGSGGEEYATRAPAPDPETSPDSPTFVEVIKEASKVGTQNVVHLRLQERVRQRIQRMMLAAPLTKPVREAEKILL